VIGAAFLFGIIFLPLYLVNVTGVSATDAGLAMMPLTLGIVASSIGAGQLVSRVGHPKLIMLASLAFLAGAFGLLGFTLSPDSTQWSVSVRMLLMGLGVGPTLPLYTLVMQAASEPRELGVVTATATFSRLLGQVIGLALFGTLFASALSHAIAGRASAELRMLTPEVRVAIGGGGTAGALSGEGGSAVAFDTAAASARVRAVAPGDDIALAAVGRMHRAFELAFTDAVTLLFKVGIGLVMLGFLVTALMPTVELRHTPRESPAVRLE
jgi:MFS family permease